MTENLTREELTMLCMAKLEELGKTSGGLLFQKALMWDLPLDDLEAQVEAAVKDVEDHLTDGGADDSDVRLACCKFRLALLQEGRRLIALIPDAVYEGGIQ